MKKDEIFENILIDNADINGNGIARIDQIVVFIKNAMKDEVVDIKIISMKQNYAFAEIVKFHKKSINRLENKCPHTLCGGCSFLHTTKEYEMEAKENYLKRMLGDNVDKIIYPSEYNYRNKVTFHVEDSVLGYYQEKTNDLVPIDNCLLLDDDINDFHSDDIKRILILYNRIYKHI
jgi:23S rRNA (uracil1939-C5)-methyltransferase